jgi:hypothetical protein
MLPKLLDEAEHHHHHRGGTRIAGRDRDRREDRQQAT